MWTKSACVVLAWTILIIVAAVGPTRSARPGQADIDIASSTTDITPASTPSAAAAPVRTARPAARYAVRPGDTLSGIAARFAVRGGWPALYAANRPLIGPDPNVIYPGTVLLLPGQAGSARYTVAAGDTLSGIAAALGVTGGWPALYAANRPLIGPDPDIIHAGTVLTIPHPAAPASAASRPGHRPSPPPPSAPPGSRHRPVRTSAPTAAGMPQWLKTLLLAVGLGILAVFLAGLVLAVRRWRQQAAGRAVQSGNAWVRSRPDRGGRSRSVVAAVRAVTATARVHPVGVAVPSAVLVTGIVLFTFVNSATIRVVPPPGGSGRGSVCAAGRIADQPPHRLQPRQPGPPGQPALLSGPEQSTWSLTSILEQVVLLRPVSVAAPLAGPGRAPQASRNPSSRLPGGGLVCNAKQVPRLRLRPRPRAGV
jgi:LysM repeat protein